MPAEITIPETITVHLGPPDSNAQNVTVNFVDYIKNVASSEIYPTWPENAIRANVLAQISFALNRIYTEHYRTRGYDFDITSSPAYDQAFVNGRNIFENISNIVDDVFNDYVVGKGEFIPLFTQYCDGKTVQCDGLSQWGSVTLAEQGLSPFEILQRYYGNDIQIVDNAPVENMPASYNGTPLKLGSSGKQVTIMQNALNRISKNYPNIKPIPQDAIGYFGVSTQDAVKEFQKTFNLTQDGIIGKSTWYKIIYVYIAVKKLAELDSEGLLLEDVEKVLSEVLQEGSKGVGVQRVQYLLSVIAIFNNSVQAPSIDGVFGPATKKSVESFQRAYNLPVTGQVDKATYDKMNEVATPLISKVPENPEIKFYKNFPGKDLSIGSEDENVRLMQSYLNKIAKVYKTIPVVDETGYYGAKTAQTVSAFQEQFELPVTGTIGPVTWYSIINVVSDIS